MLAIGKLTVPLDIANRLRKLSSEDDLCCRPQFYHRVAPSNLVPKELRALDHVGDMSFGFEQYK